MFNRIVNYWKEIFFLVVLMGLCIVFSLYTKSDNFNPEHEDVVTITVNGGGEIMSFYDQYTNLRVKNKYLRVEGLCASACTFFLGLVPPDHVCASEQARFGFHGIYTMLGPNFTTYKWFTPFVYPEWVLKKLREEYGFDGSVADVDSEKYPGKIIWMNRDDLNIQHCED